HFHRLLRGFWIFYGDFVFKFFSLDSILFALFDILTLFQGRLNTYSPYRTIISWYLWADVDGGEGWG
ncbi:hypothetical protein, partial [Leptospira kirschneri]|uniref:hypothetical protein n=1 Tax=Leptospira kirschneri TaxID=29507 RepID=UPI003562C706